FFLPVRDEKVVLSPRTAGELTNFGRNRCKLSWPASKYRRHCVTTTRSSADALDEAKRVFAPGLPERVMPQSHFSGNDSAVNSLNCSSSQKCGKETHFFLSKMILP
ncbi:hypothetical protein L914_14704, partial [Phytophthora nicotianae]